MHLEETAKPFRPHRCSRLGLQRHLHAELERVERAHGVQGEAVEAAAQAAEELQLTDDDDDAREAQRCACVHQRLPVAAMPKMRTPARALGYPV